VCTCLGRKEERMKKGTGMRREQEGERRMKERDREGRKGRGRVEKRGKRKEEREGKAREEREVSEFLTCCFSHCVLFLDDLPCCLLGAVIRW